MKKIVILAAIMLAALYATAQSKKMIAQPGDTLIVTQGSVMKPMRAKTAHPIRQRPQTEPVRIAPVSMPTKVEVIRPTAPPVVTLDEISKIMAQHDNAVNINTAIVGITALALVAILLVLSNRNGYRSNPTTINVQGSKSKAYGGSVRLEDHWVMSDEPASQPSAPEESSQ